MKKPWPNEHLSDQVIPGWCRAAAPILRKSVGVINEAKLHVYSASRMLSGDSTGNDSLQNRAKSTVSLLYEYSLFNLVPSMSSFQRLTPMWNLFAVKLNPSLGRFLSCFKLVLLI